MITPDNAAFIEENPCFTAAELPPVPDWARKAPGPKEATLFDLD